MTEQTVSQILIFRKDGATLCYISTLQAIFDCMQAAGICSFRDAKGQRHFNPACFSRMQEAALVSTMPITIHDEGSRRKLYLYHARFKDSNGPAGLKRRLGSANFIALFMPYDLQVAEVFRTLSLKISQALPECTVAVMETDDPRDFLVYRGSDSSNEKTG